MTADWIANARAALMNPMVTYKEDATERLPLALKALDAVLEIHAPRDHRPLDGIYLGGKVCDACRQPWPCRTVVMIREALDVSD